LSPGNYLGLRNLLNGGNPDLGLSFKKLSRFIFLKRYQPIFLINGSMNITIKKAKNRETILYKMVSSSMVAFNGSIRDECG
jgi:hypothetical protein